MAPIPVPIDQAGVLGETPHFHIAHDDNMDFLLCHHPQSAKKSSDISRAETVPVFVLKHGPFQNKMPHDTFYRQQAHKSIEKTMHFQLE